MENMQQKLQFEVESMISNLDKKYMRKMRKDGFLCSAKCCDTSPNHEQLQNCVNQCQNKSYASEQIFSNELNQFQARLQRCAIQCKDNVQTRANIAQTSNDVDTLNKLQVEVDNCAQNCIVTNLKSLKQLETSIEAQLKKL